LKKGTIPPVTHKKRLAAGKEHHSITASARLILIFQLSLKRSYFRKPKGEATQKRSYPEARSYTEADCHNSSTNLFQPEGRVKGEVELNYQGDIHIHIPSIKIVQSILGSEPFHCRFTKSLKGVLLTLEKDGTPAFIFSRSKQRLTY